MVLLRHKIQGGTSYPMHSPLLMSYILQIHILSPRVDDVPKNTTIKTQIPLPCLRHKTLAVIRASSQLLFDVSFISYFFFLTAHL